MLMQTGVSVTTNAGNRSTAAVSSASAMVEGGNGPASGAAGAKGEPPPHGPPHGPSHGRIMMSGHAPEGSIVSMSTMGSSGIVVSSVGVINSRAATLSALGSSVGSSGGGMSDSGFAASISSGFGPGSSSTGSTSGGGHVIGPNKPDLSHLTAEERAIIENVIHRQHTEENKEYEFLR